MPMNAPVIATTGIDATPTAKNCGPSSRQRIHFRARKISHHAVDPTKLVNRPNSATDSRIDKPKCEMAEIMERENFGALRLADEQANRTACPRMITADDDRLRFQAHAHFAWIQGPAFSPRPVVRRV